MTAFEPCPPGWFTLHAVYGTDSKGNETHRTYRRRVIGWGVRELPAQNFTPIEVEVFPLVTEGDRIAEPGDDFFMLWHTGDSYCTCWNSERHAPSRDTDDPWWCDQCEGEIPA